MHDVFEENGTAYYVMEYLSGGSLLDLQKLKDRLSESDALGYIRQAAFALDYIHSLKINHLDIKPGNILLDGKGRAVLIDFGH
ncbi:MAG: serine/threonine protein kinase [Candidatus Cryptobacteroides sp.]